MKLSKHERDIIMEVIGDALWNSEGLRHRFGSITVEEMGSLYSKLKYWEYCIRNKIEYEEMTEEDFERAYFEENEG